MRALVTRTGTPQFSYINEQAADHLAAGDPVISVGTKKKLLVGEYKNAGREWRPAGEPEKVKVHDFSSIETLGKAKPYGVYDLAAETGWVGYDDDTAEFAVETIRRWWNTMGANAYPSASRLLITADGGGSNGWPPMAPGLELQPETRTTNQAC